MWLVFAALAAVCFGLRGISYQWTSKKPIDRNMLLLGVYVCGAVVAVVAGFLLHQQWTMGALVGIVMGVFSYTSNASMYKGFSVGKASIIAIFTGMPPIVVVLLAYLLWGETLNGGQFAAFAIILCGILLLKISGDLSFKNAQGLQWGVITMITFACTDVATKQATLWGGDTFPTLFLMYATGTILFLISWLASRRKAVEQEPQSSPAPVESLAVPVPWTISRTFGIGLAVGIFNISGMMFLLTAFRHGITGLVSAVSALNVLIILFYARVFLQEKFNRRELAGMVCTLVGVICLRLLS